jgi:hypothetical protein
MRRWGADFPRLKQTFDSDPGSRILSSHLEGSQSTL